MSKETTKQSDNVPLAILLVIIFVCGIILGMIYAGTFPAQDPTIVPITNNELMDKLNKVTTECAKPHNGTVTITGKDIVDAIRGKQLLFTVETTTE